MNHLIIAGLITLTGFLINKLLNEQKVKSFGELLGETNGVKAYSCHNHYNPNDSNYINNIFTGIKWQCVEYARRYLIITKGITFANVNNAYDIFDLHYFISLKNNSQIPIKKYKNGTLSEKPNIDSLLIYNKNHHNTGHVAVITFIGNNYIIVSEQNYDNIKHTQTCSRKS